MYACSFTDIYIYMRVYSQIFTYNYKIDYVQLKLLLLLCYFMRNNFSLTALTLFILNFFSSFFVTYSLR